MIPLEQITKSSPTSSITISFLVVILIGIVDHLIVQEISIYVFYSLPIAYSCWFAGRKAGILLSIASALAWFIHDLLEGPNSLLLYWNMLVRTGFFIFISLILAAWKSAFERERALAHKDFLTGLANRRTFFEMGSLEIKRALRSRRPFTLAFIDLDNFKAINDRFGHSMGDTLLYTVAQKLRGNTRATDLVARLGGDEFVLLFPETDRDACEIVLSKILDQLKEAMNQNQWEITFSIGMTTYRIPPETVDEMIENADRLMYAAKQKGKNTMVQEVLDKSPDILSST